MKWYEPAREPVSNRCEFCYGTGVVGRRTAYVAGPDPFKGPMDTMAHAAQCKHCRGTGDYDSALDPTLDHERGE